MKIGFIGAGTVGTALATCLSRQGYRVEAVSSRSPASAEKLANSLPGCRALAGAQNVADVSELVFITTPDAAIPMVASQICWHAGHSVIHCSGADSTETLAPAKKAGARTGAFHPLQTFASVKQAVDNLPGSTFAIEAEEPLLKTLREFAAALQGHSIQIKAEDKVLYHAAAVITSNYLVTLVKMATDLWVSFGVSREEAAKALMPLLKGTLNNIENVGIPQCLTGPIARGDAGTISKHLKALEKAAPAILDAYRELGRQTIPISQAKGKISAEQAQELESLLRCPPSAEAKNKGEHK